MKTNSKDKQNYPFNYNKIRLNLMYEILGFEVLRIYLINYPVAGSSFYEKMYAELFQLCHNNFI